MNFRKEDLEKRYSKELLEISETELSEIIITTVPEHYTDVNTIKVVKKLQYIFQDMQKTKLKNGNVFITDHITCNIQILNSHGMTYGKIRKIYKIELLKENLKTFTCGITYSDKVQGLVPDISDEKPLYIEKKVKKEKLNNSINIYFKINKYLNYNTETKTLLK